MAGLLGFPAFVGAELAPPSWVTVAFVAAAFRGGRFSPSKTPHPRPIRRHRSLPLHPPTPNQISQRPRDKSPKNIGDVVIPSPNRRHAHQKNQRCHHPE